MFPSVFNTPLMKATRRLALGAALVGMTKCLSNIDVYEENGSFGKAAYIGGYVAGALYLAHGATALLVGE